MLPVDLGFDSSAILGTAFWAPGHSSPVGTGATATGTTFDMNPRTVTLEGPVERMCPGNRAHPSGVESRLPLRPNHGAGTTKFAPTRSHRSLSCPFDRGALARLVDPGGDAARPR